MEVRVEESSGNPEDAEATTVKRHAHPMKDHPQDRHQKLKWDPVFQFPPAEEVMKALYQTEVSPWILLSSKSAHREKLRERYVEIKSLKHILQKMKAPSFNSIPSILEKHNPTNARSHSSVPQYTLLLSS